MLTFARHRDWYEELIKVRKCVWKYDVCVCRALQNHLIVNYNENRLSITSDLQAIRNDFTVTPDEAGRTMQINELFHVCGWNEPTNDRLKKSLIFHHRRQFIYSKCTVIVHRQFSNSHEIATISSSLYPLRQLTVDFVIVVSVAVRQRLIGQRIQIPSSPFIDYNNWK